jgi:hypothetical protein
MDDNSATTSPSITECPEWMRAPSQCRDSARRSRYRCVIDAELCRRFLIARARYPSGLTVRITKPDPPAAVPFEAVALAQ